MDRLLSLFLLAALLTGCISSRPPGNAEFGRIETLQSVEGVYRNRGERAPGNSPLYLSSLIWPIEGIDHASVEAVEVRVEGNRILVKALGKQGVLREDSFVDGVDFTMHDGKLRLKKESRVVGFRSGDPMLGYISESTHLGLDEKGEGKYRSDFAGGGLVYMFLPFAIAGSEEVRFVKVGKPSAPNPRTQETR